MYLLRYSRRVKYNIIQILRGRMIILLELSRLEKVLNMKRVGTRDQRHGVQN